MPNYVQYFGSNNVQGVAESWVEAEMSWVEVNGAGWKLKWAGWRWVEVDGAGWRCVHGLVIPIFLLALHGFLAIFHRIIKKPLGEKGKSLDFGEY